MLKIENLSAKLGSFSLKNISLEIHKGEYFVILGMSGVGKSVLLESIAGIIGIDSGQLFIHEKEITSLPIQKRGIGLVYQENTLFPHLSVKKNIGYSLKNKSEFDELVLKYASLTGCENILDRNVSTLSGGEIQRVALARTLISNPACILLDEPISSLDIQSKDEIRSLLRKFNRQGETILHVTHDFEEAISLASRVAVMENGKIIQIGSPDEIFNNPVNEFVARFVGLKNFIKGELIRKESDDLAIFKNENIEIEVLTEEENSIGYLTISSNDVMLSTEPQSSSARNSFLGEIIDIAPAKIGLEIKIDINEKIHAHISKESAEHLKIQIGKKVWVTFKASSVKFYKNKDLK